MNAIQWKEAPADRRPAYCNEGLKYLVDGEVREWKGPSLEILSPIHQPSPQGVAQVPIGRTALLDEAVARQALAAAVRAYDRGRGEWPTATVGTRIRCMEKFLARMEARRLEIARLLCWEIGKSWADSLKEFDRTVAYGRDTIAALKELDRTASRFVIDSGHVAQIRRSPYGVSLCMGPFNYPLNEAFTTLLPALIMGNPVIAKLPRIGMLCNAPLLQDFAECFPAGVINILSGDGATVVTPIIQSGHVDLLAFIGSARVANVLKHSHPKPNRLRCVLGLGAKNPAIVLPDADLDLAVRECVLGSLSFNGQRCTALKIIFVARPIADRFVDALAKAVEALPAGLPFEDNVSVTPLPELATVRRMADYLEDATARGAKVVNPGGGQADRTFFDPAVLYPVNRDMKIWHEEQFGPVVAVAPYDSIEEFMDYVAMSPFGQQASIFGSDPLVVGRLVDSMVNQVSRVNLNSQCQRGPDNFPFVGRKDSAEGTLSVTDALRVFSIRTLVAAKESPQNTELIQKIVRERRSQFLNNDYLF